MKWLLRNTNLVIFHFLKSDLPEDKEYKNWDVLYFHLLEKQTLKLRIALGSKYHPEIMMCFILQANNELTMSMLKYSSYS